MTTDLETRIRDFLREQKTGMFYNDDFANISMFLDTAVALLEETI